MLFLVCDKFGVMIGLCRHPLLCLSCFLSHFSHSMRKCKCSSALKLRCLENSAGCMGKGSLVCHFFVLYCTKDEKECRHWHLLTLVLVL